LSRSIYTKTAFLLISFPQRVALATANWSFGLPDYVDEESFEKYKPTSFRQLLEAFKEYKI
jgi:hypothetical protein